MGEASQRFRPAKPVGMAGGEQGLHGCATTTEAVVERYKIVKRA
jgi:hypothetical protein